MWFHPFRCGPDWSIWSLHKSTKRKEALWNLELSIELHYIVHKLEFINIFQWSATSEAYIPSDPSSHPFSLPFTFVCSGFKCSDTNCKDTTEVSCILQNIFKYRRNTNGDLMTRESSRQSQQWNKRLTLQQLTRTKIPNNLQDST